MKKNLISMVCLLALQLFTSKTVVAQQNTNKVPAETEQQATTLRLDPKVKMRVLPNGFTYYIRQNNTPASQVTMYLVNKVGSMQETEAERGIAHFIEHMAFNGTKHFPNHQLLDYLQKAGVRNGSDLNAETGFNETVFRFPIPSGDADLLKNALQIMRDWANDVTFDNTEIDRERGVVLEERRQHLGEQQRTMDKTLPIVFNNSLYAQRIPIGLEEVIKNASYETIKSFYKKWYRPNLQALIVVGDIDEKKIEKMIISLFSDLTNPTDAPKRVDYTIPLLNKTQFVAVTDPEIPFTTISFSIKSRQTPVSNTEVYLKEQYLNELVNTMLNARFNDISQQRDMPFTALSANFGNSQGAIHSISFTVNPKPGQIENACRAMFTEIERLKKFGFTSSELARAKTNYLNINEATYKDRATISSGNLVSGYKANFLVNSPAPGFDYDFSLFKKSIPDFTNEAVNAVLNNNITDANMDFIVTANEKDKPLLPAQASLELWKAGAAQGVITAYVDNVVDNLLMVVKPVPGKIVSEKKLPVGNVTELVLSNGLKVLLKPVTFEKDKISINGSSPGGTSVIADKDFVAATFMDRIISGGGVGNFDARSLNKFLDGKEFGGYPKITTNFQQIDGRCSSKEVENLLQLMHLYFTKPYKDKVAFDNTITSLRQQFSNKVNSPQAVFSDTINAVLYNYNLRAIAPTDAEIKAIDYDRVLALYKQRLADASNFTFVIVGDINLATIKPLLEMYLGSLPATHANETWKNTHKDEVIGSLSRKIYLGKEKVATVQLEFSGKLTPADWLNSAANIQPMCAILQYRLFDRLREGDGGVYGVRVSGLPQRIPGSTYQVSISFTCDPVSVETLILAVHQEIAKLRNEGPPYGDIEKFTAQIKVGSQQYTRRNDYWVNLILSSVQNNEELKESSEDIKKELRVNAEDIKIAVNKLLNLDNYKRFVLLPEQ